MLDNADIKHRVNEINSINDNNCEYYHHHWLFYDKFNNTICTLNNKDNIIFNMLCGLKFKFSHDSLDQFKHTETIVKYSFSQNTEDLLDLTTEYI